MCNYASCFILIFRQQTDFLLIDSTLFPLFKCETPTFQAADAVTDEPCSYSLSNKKFLLRHPQLLIFRLAKIAVESFEYSLLQVFKNILTVRKSKMRFFLLRLCVERKRLSGRTEQYISILIFNMNMKQMGWLQNT